MDEQQPIWWVRNGCYTVLYNDMLHIAEDGRLRKDCSWYAKGPAHIIRMMDSFQMRVVPPLEISRLVTDPRLIMPDGI